MEGEVVGLDLLSPPHSKKRKSIVHLHLLSPPHSKNAPAPWGMQPNTSLAALSPRSPWAFPCSCLCAYYTIFGNFLVNSCDSCGRRSGKKSILSAVASLAAVRKVMLTSW